MREPWADSAVVALSGGAFSKALEVYHPMCARGMGSSRPPIPAHRLMILAGLSLGGVLASKNRLRFTRRNDLNTRSLNDVLAHNSLNDVLALDT